MITDKSTLQVYPADDKYSLQITDADGSIRKMELSAADLLKLAQSSLLIQNEILAKQPLAAKGIEAVQMTVIAGIELNTEIYSSFVHLTMFDANGKKMGFALPLSVAQPLAERLPIRVVELERVAKQTSKH